MVEVWKIRQATIESDYTGTSRYFVLSRGAATLYFDCIVIKQSYVYEFYYKGHSCFQLYNSLVRLQFNSVGDEFFTDIPCKFPKSKIILLIPEKRADYKYEIDVDYLIKHIKTVPTHCGKDMHNIGATFYDGDPKRGCDFLCPSCGHIEREVVVEFEEDTDREIDRQLDEMESDARLRGGVSFSVSNR